ncbi:S4 domain protein [Streptococcus parauberis]|nr:RNA-binding protein [Streptococcus parauberis]RFE02572.1 S4 domain protein [Streptococcus parauberis]
MMVNLKDKYQHFHPEEYSFIDKVSEIINRVEDTYVINITDFLNPRQIDILKSLVAPTKLQTFSSNDYYGTEYGRVIIAPAYYQFDQNDFELDLLEINYNAKFNQLRHSQILGTLINELGIKRESMGDILVEEGYGQLMISHHLLNYFLGNISKIGRASVTLKKIPINQLIKEANEMTSTDILVSSLRIDLIMASVIKMSRSQAMKFIESEKVKVNYRKVTRTSDNLALGDMISVRGYGRFKIESDNGLSKNGKIKLTISKTMRK